MSAIKRRDAASEARLLELRERNAAIAQKMIAYQHGWAATLAAVPAFAEVVHAWRAERRNAGGFLDQRGRTAKLLEELQEIAGRMRSADADDRQMAAVDMSERMACVRVSARRLSQAEAILDGAAPEVLGCPKLYRQLRSEAARHRDAFLRARDELVCINQGIATGHLQRFKGRIVGMGLSMEDARLAGLAGLSDAIERWDPTQSDLPIFSKGYVLDAVEQYLGDMQTAVPHIACSLDELEEEKALLSRIVDIEAVAPEDVIADRERRRIVRELLSGLDPQHCEVLRLSHCRDRSAKDVAKLLGVSEGEVKGLREKAARSARKYLRERGLTEAAKALMAA